MSGIIGSKLNIRGSGLVASYGTDGQHMLSAGPGVSNVFETSASGGDVVKVGSGSFTSGDPASVAIDGYFDDTTYYFYKLFAMFQITDASSDTTPHLLQRINIGGTAQTSGAYDWWITEGRFASGTGYLAGRGGADATYARAVGGFNATQTDASDGNTYWLGEYEFYKPQDTTVNKTWKFSNTMSAYHSAGAWTSRDNGGGSYASTSAITGVTFLYENGQGFEKGYWSIYGYKF